MDTVTITSGKYRGRKIATPGAATHPMGSRERLALFNMLDERIKNAYLLDAFAGSGALGIEALSRGSIKVVFVDDSVKAVQTIKKNLKVLGIDKEATVIKTKAANISNDFLNFDVILADPPYDNFNQGEIECLTNTLKGGGLMALSHPDDAPVLEGLTLLKSRQYANAHISIYVKN